MFAKFAIAAATAALLSIAVGSSANAQSISTSLNTAKPAVSIPKPPVSTPVVNLPMQGQANVPAMPAPKPAPPSVPSKPTMPR